MKKFVSLLIILTVIVGCSSSQNTVPKSKETAMKPSDTVRIANDEVEYEIMIIDPGFNAFLYGQARPRGYHSLEILEQRNSVYVREWNMRALQPQYSQLYEMQIDYVPTIRYGYEVNYLLYNYFVYFQNRYNQRLGGFVPRI